MSKRILSIVVSLVMILGMCSFGVLAESADMEPIYHDFTDMASAGDGPVPGFSRGGYKSYVRYFYPKKGIGGKDAEDVSVHYQVRPNFENTSKSLYLDKTIASTKATVLEYSILKEDYLTTQQFKFKNASDGWVTISVPQFSSSGSIVAGSNNLGKYELNRWYRVAIVFNVPSNTYDYYLNGELLLEGAVGTSAPLNGLNLIRFQSDHSVNDQYMHWYLDDVKIYNGVYNNSETLTEISSEVIVVDNENKIIKMTEEGTVDSILNALDATQGTILGVYDPTVKTKRETNVSIGDLVMVVAPDGFTYSYYRISESVLLKETTYTVIENKITNVGRYTPIEGFLNNITLDVPEANKGVYKDGQPVTEGFVDDTMTFQYSYGGYSNSMPIELGMIIDTDFEGYRGKLHTGQPVEDRVFPKDFPFYDPVGNGYNETPDSVYIEGVNLEGKGDVLKFYSLPIDSRANQSLVYNNFPVGKYQGGSYTLEFSVMTPDMNTIKLINFKGYHKDSTSESFWPDFIELYPNGQVRVFRSAVAPYETNKWHHFVVSVDLTEKTLTLLLDGAKVVDNKYMGSNITEDITQFRLQNRLSYGVESTVYFDDVKLYPTYNSQFNDPAYSTEVTSEVYDVDYVKSQIRFYNQGETVDEFMSNMILDKSYSDIVVLDANSNYLAGDDLAVPGIVLRVTSENGLATRDYVIDNTNVIGRITYSTESLEVGELAASVNVKLFNDSLTKATMVIAVYEKGKLANIKIQEYNFEFDASKNYIDETISATINVAEVTEDTKVKAMFVNGISSLEPLTYPSTIFPAVK